jgi:hypothetical protein
MPTYKCDRCGDESSTDPGEGFFVCDADTKRSPGPGDVTICMNCGFLAQFSNDMQRIQSLEGVMRKTMPTGLKYKQDQLTEIYKTMAQLKTTYENLDGTRKKIISEIVGKLWDEDPPCVH